MSNSSMSECIVIGGGVIGLLTARALFKSGMDVLVLERGALGGESSWAGGGIVSPLYPWRYADAVNQLAERSKQLYPQLIAELLDESGVDSELLNSGLFTVVHNEVESIRQWGKRWLVDMEYVSDRAEIKSLEPMVGAAVDAGFWMPDIMQVRNPELVKALKGSFNKLSIAYREHCPAEEILIEKNKVTGVRAKNKVFHSNKIVIASGAWTTQFTSTRTSVAVQPVKGQMIMYRGDPGLLKRMVLAGGHYIIPRKDGRILAGSTLEKVGFDKTISDDAMAELHQAAISLVPRLKDLTIERQWAGLRPGTEQGIPYICAHDEIDGLYVHAGHYRNGIVLGAASAELMAAILLEQIPKFDVSPYSITALH